MRAFPNCQSLGKLTPAEASFLVMEKRGRLTPPVIAPPLRHVIGFAKGSWQVVVRPFVRQRKICRAEEHDKGELRQVDLMDLLEDLPWPVPGQTACPGQDCSRS